jgi:BioD-like phosphotransacetylase family protein
MTARGIVDYLQPGVLIITPGDRDDIVLAAVSSARLSDDKTIAGLILTNDTVPSPKLLELLSQTRIPVIAAKEESFTITSKIHGMTVKTQPRDTDKIPVIKRLITEHVDLNKLLAAC